MADSSDTTDNSSPPVLEIPVRPITIPRPGCGLTSPPFSSSDDEFYDTQDFFNTKSSLELMPENNKCGRDSLPTPTIPDSPNPIIPEIISQDEALTDTPDNENLINQNNGKQNGRYIGFYLIMRAIIQQQYNTLMLVKSSTTTPFVEVEDDTSELSSNIPDAPTDTDHLTAPDNFINSWPIAQECSSSNINGDFEQYSTHINNNNNDDDDDEVTLTGIIAKCLFKILLDQF